MSTGERPQLDRLSAQELVARMHAEDSTVAGAVAATLPQVATAVDALVARLARGGRLIMVGAGSSGRLGVLDAVECDPTFGVGPEQVLAVLAGGPDAMYKSVEGAEDDESASAEALRELNLAERDAVVGIAASGSTPFVCGALRCARERHAATIAISCRAPAPLLELAEIGIAALTGPEFIAGSTRLKAGTAQKMILNMISTATMIRLGHVHDNLMVDVRVRNAKLEARARDIVAELADVSAGEAAQWLRRAGREVKPAVLMARRKLNLAEARACLAEKGGHLRDCL